MVSGCGYINSFYYTTFLLRVNEKNTRELCALPPHGGIGAALTNGYIIKNSLHTVSIDAGGRLLLIPGKRRAYLSMIIRRAVEGGNGRFPFVVGHIELHKLEAAPAVYGIPVRRKGLHVQSEHTLMRNGGYRNEAGFS